MRTQSRFLRSLRLSTIAALAAAGFVASGRRLEAVVLYNGGTYSQNFDSLTSVTNTSSGADTVSWTNDVTLPGWSLFRQPSPGTAITTYKGGDGSVNTGSFYSFGTTNVAERALGGVASGGAYFGSPVSTAIAGWIAVGITNNSSSTLGSANVQFDGEQWRDGGFSPTGSAAQTMVLEYGFGATFAAVSNWIVPGGTFNFTSPNFGSTVGTGVALDGNLAINRTAGLGGTISNLTWNAGDTLWIRWDEVNDLGNDHALAVDNFQFSATAVPEPASCVIAGLGLVGLAVAALRRRGKR